MRRTIVAALAAALLLTAAGCSQDEPRPKFADPTETTKSAGSEPVADSAEDAVELWISGWNDLSNTGNASTIRVASDEACGACDNFIQPVLDLYEAGGQIETRGWSIKSLKASTSMGADPYIDVTVRKAGGTNRPDANSARARFAASNERIRFVLTEDDEAWTVSDILSLQ